MNGNTFHVVYEAVLSSTTFTRSIAADGSLGPAATVAFATGEQPHAILPTATGFTVFANDDGDGSFYLLDTAGVITSGPLPLPVDNTPCAPSTARGQQARPWETASWSR